MLVAALPPCMNSLPLEGKVPRRGGWGRGGMKESEKMRFKQAIYGSRRVKETLIFLTEMPEGGIQVTSH